MKEQHWTDEQLIAHLYGVGPADHHILECAPCALRLRAMQESRSHVETANAASSEINPEFLAAQRRAIYARLERSRWSDWGRVLVRRWAPVFAMIVVIAGVAVVYEQRQADQARRISDSQLFEEVGHLAEDTTPAAVEPMEGMFE